ncbi:MAG: DUF2141 domain-containing protein [Allosphingosinicella sp.]
MRLKTSPAQRGRTAAAIRAAPWRAAATATIGFIGLSGAAAPAEPRSANCAGPPSATRLFVDVDHVGTSRGVVAVTVFADDPQKFLVKLGSLYVGRAPATVPVTHLCLNLPRPGVYALAAYHDANSNGKFDRTALGLPAEGYGFSNNPAIWFRPPPFRAVRFTVARSGQHTAIRMKY